MLLITRQKANPTGWSGECARRIGGMRGEVYLHLSRQPLDEVDLSTDADHGQLMLWNAEC